MGLEITVLGCQLQNMPKFHTQLNLVLVHHTIGQRPRQSQLSLLQKIKTHKNKGQTSAYEALCFDHPFSRPDKICTYAPTRQRCDTLSSSHNSHVANFDKETLEHAGQKSTKHAHNALTHISACTARSMSAGPSLPS